MNNKAKATVWIIVYGFKNCNLYIPLKIHEIIKLNDTIMLVFEYWRGNRKIISSIIGRIKPTKRNVCTDPMGNENQRISINFDIGKYFCRIPNKTRNIKLKIIKTKVFNILMCVFSSMRLNEGLKMNEKKFKTKVMVFIHFVLPNALKADASLGLRCGVDNYLLTFATVVKYYWLHSEFPWFVVAHSL